MRGLCVALCFLWGCNSGGSAPREIVASCGEKSGVQQGQYLDPVTYRSRTPGSTFVEILQVTAFDDDLVMYCSGVKGLQVIDAANPDDMQAIARIVSANSSSLYPRCQHLARSGDIVFFTHHGDEIQTTPFLSAASIASVRNNGNAPELASVADPNFIFEGLAAVGNFVYVAGHSRGLGIYELFGNSLVQRAVTNDGVQNAWAVAVHQDIAYVGDQAGALVSFDVSNPSAPTMLGRATFDGGPQSVVIDNSAMTAFVAAGAGGLVAIDVSNPASPTVLSQTSTRGSALQVSLTQDHAVVANWNDIVVFDVTSASAPVSVIAENVPSPGPFSRVLGAAAHQSTIFAGEWHGLHAMSLHTDRSAPDIWYQEEDIDFGQVHPGDSGAAYALLIHNRGEQPLSLTDIRVEKGTAHGLCAKPGDLVVAPHGVGVVEIEFHPTTDNAMLDWLVMQSDDPDEAECRIPLRANASRGLGAGDPAPNVQVDLVANGSGRWRLADAQGSVVLLSYFATF